MLTSRKDTMLAVAIVGLTFLGILALATSRWESEQEIALSDAWMRPLLPSKSITSGYCVIKNSSFHDVLILSAHSPSMTKIEFHESIYENDMHKMRKLDQLTIPAQGTLRLEPGGKHLMLFGIQKSTSNEYEIQFELDDGQILQASFPTGNLSGRVNE